MKTSASNSPVAEILVAYCVLFLDEASSALDDGVERDIMSHVRALSADVTVLAITHRRSVIAPTDPIVELGAEVCAIAP